MKIINIEAMNRMDPEDVSDNAENPKQRKGLRLAIIKRFFKWANTRENKAVWTTADASIEDNVVLKRHRNFQRMLMGFGAVTNFFLYQAFATGIYNYRNRELLNTRRIPVVAKLGLTTAVTGTMCYLLYQDHLYDEETYKTALKFRDRYDTIEVPMKTKDVFS